MDICLTK